MHRGSDKQQKTSATSITGTRIPRFTSSCSVAKGTGDARGLNMRAKEKTVVVLLSAVKKHVARSEVCVSKSKYHDRTNLEREEELGSFDVEGN